VLELIKKIWNEIIKTLLEIYDKLTYPIGVDPIAGTNVKSSFRTEGIFFQNYPFRAASIYPTGIVSYTHIKEILPNATPPEIRTKTGEVLFIAAELKEELKKIAEENQIPIVERVDVWDRILEPFLDTEFTLEQEETTLAILENNGISRQECQKIREFVSDAMYSYNIVSGLWDWVHLGLYDVLAALSGDLSGHRHKLADEDFRNFYYHAMDIAMRAKLVSEN
jgi:hypothetical protein